MFYFPRICCDTLAMSFMWFVAKYRHAWLQITKTHSDEGFDDRKRKEIRPVYLADTRTRRKGRLESAAWLSLMELVPPKCGYKKADGMSREFAIFLGVDGTVLELECRGILDNCKLLYGIRLILNHIWNNEKTETITVFLTGTDIGTIGAYLKC